MEWPRGFRGHALLPREPLEATLDRRSPSRSAPAPGSRCRLSLLRPVRERDVELRPPQDSAGYRRCFSRPRSSGSSVRPPSVCAQRGLDRRVGSDDGRHAPGRPLLVLTVHGDIANMAESDGAIRAGGPGRRFAEEIESNAYRAADTLFAVDQRLGLHCAALGGERAITVMRNFVNTDRFRPPRAEDAERLRGLRRELRLAEADRVLLVPRRLVKKNGVVFAVRALAESRIREFSGERVVLAIAGRGPEGETIEREAHRLGVSEAAGGLVRMLGDVPRASLAALYQLADCVLILGPGLGGDRSNVSVCTGGDGDREARHRVVDRRSRRTDQRRPHRRVGASRRFSRDRRSGRTNPFR